MSRTVAVLVGVGCLASLSFALASATQADRGERVVARKVPDTSIYANFPQPGLHHLGFGETRLDQEDFERVRLNAGRVKASNILLVEADGVRAAIRGTERVRAGGSQLVPAVPPQQGLTIWVAAFLGCQSSTPPAWEVRRVEVANKTVRVVYATPAPSPQNAFRLFRSTDDFPYLVWADLGRLELGQYTVELVDSDQHGEAVLSRKVTIKLK